MMYYRSRPTVYKGIRMRSRLEASFAASLDSVADITWRYEPQCFADSTGQYLPDFLITSEGYRDYFEIKPPTADISDALLKMHIIRGSEPKVGLYVVVPTGEYPNQGWKFAGSCRDEQPCALCIHGPFGEELLPPPRMVIRRDPPTDPVTGRAAIGGRARNPDGTPRPPKVYGR